MKFQTLKMEVCAATEPGRYAMHGVRLEREIGSDTLGRAIATNGRVLACVPIDIEPTDDIHGQIVPLEAVKLARKVAGAKKPATLNVNGSIVAAGQTFNAIDGAFPRYRAVAGEVSAESHAIVTLDADYLRNACDAIAARSPLGSAPITLCVPIDRTAPVVFLSEAGGLALVMPLELENIDATLARVQWARAATIDGPTAPENADGAA